VQRSRLWVLAFSTWSLTAASGASVSPALLWAAAVAGLVFFLAAFVWVENERGEQAIMPLSMFATGTFAGLTLYNVFSSMRASVVCLLLLPFLLIRIEGWPAVSRRCGTPCHLPILIGLGSRLMGGLAARYGGRLPLAAGAAIVAFGLLQFAWVSSSGINYWSEILPATLLAGMGMAISVAPLTANRHCLGGLPIMSAPLQGSTVLSPASVE